MIFTWSIYSILIEMNYYAKRGLEILREEGPKELVQKSKDHLLWDRLFSTSRRFRLQTFKNYHISRMKYDAPSLPDKLIWVNPKEINYYNNCIDKEGGLGQIESGDWDKNKSSWRDTWRYKGLKERFVDGKRWKETVYFEHHKKMLNKKGSVSGCGTLDEFIDIRCSYIDKLYISLKRDGYRIDNKRKLEKRTRIQPIDQYEPFASITREGEIQANEGSHRRALAEFAGIERIPLNVLVRHREWQEFRDKIHNQGLSEDFAEDLRNHPDLQDILD